MSVLVPAIQIPLDRLVTIKQSLAGRLQAIVQASSTGTAGQEIIYRDLLAADVAVTATTGRVNSGTLSATTLASNVFSTFTLTSFQALGIYGYAALSPNPQIDEIDFTVSGNVVLAKFTLDPLYCLQQSVGYFVDPIIWNPQETVGVNLLSQAGVTNEQFCLIGYMAEPAGRTVAPRTSAA
jgi:hypothetical protein